MNVALPKPCATSGTDAKSAGSPGWPFVATSLEVWFTREPNRLARDCQIDDTVYRRLDPEYFAWLRSRMFVVKRAAEAGQVSREAFGDLCARFNAIQEWAIKAFGETVLLTAAGNLKPETYRPPLAEPDRTPSAADPVDPRRTTDGEQITRARTLVDEIRERALAVGWTVDGLYFSEGYARRPFGGKYGLVCYIGAQDRIGEVTRESIEIIGPPPIEIRNRFYNARVEQPWAKSVGGSA